MLEKDQLQSFITELRRGSLTLAVLACLKEPHYGYALLQTMQEKNIDIEANTLYPLLRRLESQGLLTSDWDTSESRPRKFYSVSEKGTFAYQVLWQEWVKIRDSIENVYEKGEKDGQLN